LDIYHPNARCLRVSGCEDPWLFFTAQKVPRARTFWEHSFKAFIVPVGSNL